VDEGKEIKVLGDKRERESTNKQEMLNNMRLILDDCSLSMEGIFLHGRMI